MTATSLGWPSTPVAGSSRGLPCSTPRIAKELVEAVKASVTIDWTLRDVVRAQIRVIVRRILKKHGYPSDLQERATQTVLEQAKVLSATWATG